MNKSCGADFFILMHKKNDKRDTWYHLTSKGAGKAFAKKFKTIRYYWRRFVKAYLRMLFYIALLIFYSVLLCIGYWYVAQCVMLHSNLNFTLHLHCTYGYNECPFLQDFIIPKIKQVHKVPSYHNAYAHSRHN